MNLDDQKFLQLIGSRLRDYRRARGFSQAELGKRCQLHRTFIGSVERGERNIAVLNIRRIAKVLRVSLTELLKD